MYDFFDQDGPGAEACGQVKIDTRSGDTLCVKYGQEKWRNQAFVTAILRETKGQNQVNIFSLIRPIMIWRSEMSPF